MDKIEHVTYGTDDADPNNIDEATKRRKRMWARLEAKITILSVSSMIIAGIVVARFIIDLINDAL